MRVLCSVTGSPSHARALLPLARALARAGHEILIVVPASLTETFSGEPVQVRAVLPDLITYLRHQLSKHGPPLTRTEPRGFNLSRFAEMITHPVYFNESYRRQLPLARDFRPHLVLRDGFELASALVAETLGIPHLAVPSGAANIMDPNMLADGLAARCDDLGLAPVDGPQMIYRYGRIDCVPPEYSFSTYSVQQLWSYRQPFTVEPTEILPPWLVELPTDRPLVLAAIGTAVPLIAELRSANPELATTFDPLATLRAIIHGLSELDCVAVVATGELPVDGADKGDHVYLTKRFPQPLLLHCAQLFITHAGYNGVREAIAAGVPMAALPQFGDQPLNADRIQQLGLGARIPTATPEGIARTCERVLRDPGISAAVRRAQRRMFALPGIEAAVTDLEQLAGAGTSTRGW